MQGRAQNLFGTRQSAEVPGALGLEQDSNTQGSSADRGLGGIAASRTPLATADPPTPQEDTEARKDPKKFRYKAHFYL